MYEPISVACESGGGYGVLLVAKEGRGISVGICFFFPLNLLCSKGDKLYFKSVMWRQKF